MKFNYQILQKLRNEKGYTQKAVAKGSDMKRSTYEAKENGRIAISFKDLQAIAQFYKKDLSEFFEWDGTEKILQKEGGDAMSEKYLEHIRRLELHISRLEKQLETYERTSESRDRLP